MQNVSIFLFTLVSVSVTFGKNVILWAPPLKSHRISMYPVAGILAERGHKVVLVSEEIKLEKVSPPPGVKETHIELRDKSYYLWGPLHYRNDTAFDLLVWKVQFNALMMEMPWRYTCRTCHEWLTNQRGEYDDVINSHKWDLILIDPLFTPCGFVHTKLAPEVPFGFVHTTFLETLVSDQQALSWSIGTIAPEFPGVHFEASRFRSRLDSVKNYLFFSFVTKTKINSFVDDALRPFVGRVSIFDFYRESQASLVAYPSLLDWTYPIGSDVVNFGSACEFLARKSLPKDMEAFVSDPKSKGTILLAFGTNVAWEYAPKRTFEAVLTVLKSFSDYRVIWGYKGPKLDLPKHIWVTSWVPQTDLLLHPRTKLFWSHGGIKSLKETVCAGVPAVYMPLFAEQVRNAFLAMAHGFGEVVDKGAVTDTQMVIGTIRKVLETPEYKANAVRMRETFGDHLVRPSLQSAWLAELLMKHGGMPTQFQRRGKRFNWIQFWNLDILAVLLLLLYLGLSCLCRGIAAALHLFRK